MNTLNGLSAPRRGCIVRDEQQQHTAPTPRRMLHTIDTPHLSQKRIGIAKVALLRTATQAVLAAFAACRGDVDRFGESVDESTIGN